MRPMMACGHQANSVLTFHDEKMPACVICDPPNNRTVVGMPDLSGREAKCAYGDSIRPSEDALKNSLAFFEYMGPGSWDSINKCKNCAYAKIAHDYFPYYFPGKCGNCNESALKYIGGEHWTCQACGKIYSNEQVEEFTGRKLAKNPIVPPHEFEAHGPYEYDKYYCGCKGWD